MVGNCLSAHGAADRRTVEEMQKKIKKRSEGHRITRFLRSRNDKDVIAGWNSSLNKLLQVFNVCLARLCSVAVDLSFSRPSSF